MCPLCETELGESDRCEDVPDIGNTLFDTPGNKIIAPPSSREWPLKSFIDSQLNHRG